MNDTHVNKPDPTTLLHAAQKVLAEYLPPDSGISSNQCVSMLLGVLDSPEANAATAHLRPKLPNPIASASVNQAEETLSCQCRVLSAEIAAIVVENTRLREAWTHTRKHETHLIQARDELIQRLAKAESKLEKLREALA